MCQDAIVGDRPLNRDVRSHMQPVRLEELLRIVGIALVSVLVGIFVHLAVLFSGPPQADGGSMVIILMFAFTMFAIALPTALAAGIGLHFLLRLRALPRLILLALFVATGFLLTAIFIPASLRSETVLILVITVTAWTLYCFGPIRLWQFKFDANEHSDF
jgi:hypothetical protein